METKPIEIRDRGTFIPALAARVSPADGFLIARAGFVEPAVILIHLQSMDCHYDPFGWPASAGRTMREAHKHIEQRWDEIAPGAVVDVEYILGETEEPKVSERFAARC